MNSDTAQPLSDAIASLLSEIQPDLEQLLQRYPKPEILEIHIEELLPTSATIPMACCLVNGILRCNCTTPSYSAMLSPAKDIALELNKIMPRLVQAIPQAHRSFEVHLRLDHATVTPQPLVCQWNNDTAQGVVLQCSNTTKSGV